MNDPSTPQEAKKTQTAYQPGLFDNPEYDRYIAAYRNAQSLLGQISGQLVELEQRRVTRLNGGKSGKGRHIRISSSAYKRILTQHTERLQELSRELQEILSNLL